MRALFNSLKSNCRPPDPARRPLGQVATPTEVADWMAGWVARGLPRSVLDPGAGEGAFVHALARLGRRGGLAAGTRITVFEVDPAMIAALGRLRTGLRPLRLAVRCEDFLVAPIRGRVDGVVCNPPYIRHHEADLDDAMLTAFDRLAGERLSRKINVYGLFLLRIASLLGPRGRAAIITPAEWLNADFGASIKRYLLRRNLLDGIVHFDPACALFDGVLTTAAIILLRRGRARDEPIGLRTARTPADLNARVIRTAAPGELDPAEKWSPLFDDARPATAGTTRVGAAARCVRGIATGANTYFVLRPSELRAAGLSRRDVRVCISKAGQVRGDRLTAADVRRLIAADQRVFLLDPRGRLSRAVRRYLRRGVAAGIDRLYLPAHRPAWFRPERRAPAPIWVNVFARGRFRFVRNEAGALHLTCFHAIYPQNGADSDRLHAALMRADARGQQRPYADGLVKLEPKDVEAIPIPNGRLRRLRLCREETGRVTQTGVR